MRNLLLFASALPIFTACNVTLGVSPHAGYDRGRAAAIDTLSVRTDSLVIAEDSLNYVFSVRYAQLTGASPTVSAATVRSVNAAVRDSVEAIERFYHPAGPVAPEDRERSTYRTDIDGGTGSVFIGADVFSAPLWVWGYTGGAHGNAFVVPINVNLRTGAPIRLADLFRPDAPWADSLSALAERGIVRKMMRDNEVASRAEALSYLFREGYAPAAAPGFSFSLAADSLTVHFVAYEVAAYVFGGTDVPLAYSDLATMMRADGAAARLRGAR